jgi:hypothetical protein
VSYTAGPYPPRPAYWSNEPPEAHALATAAALAETRQREEIARFLRHTASRSSLRFFLNPPEQPHLCVALLLHGRTVIPHSIFLDDGASVDLMDKSFADAIGTVIVPSDISLTTSTEQKADGVLGATEIIAVQYGTGPTAITSRRSFLVVQGMQNLYQVLLGNTDTIMFDGVINHKKQLYTLTGAAGEISIPTISRRV